MRLLQIRSQERQAPISRYAHVSNQNCSVRVSLYRFINFHEQYCCISCAPRISSRYQESTACSIPNVVLANAVKQQILNLINYKRLSALDI